MANGGTFDPETKYVQLGERVENHARQITDIDVRMRQGFTDVASQLRGIADDVRGGSRTQWPLIIGFSSVTISVLAGLGFLALQPIKDNVTQIREDARTEAANTKDSLTSVVQSMVTQQEIKWRTDRGLEDRKRTDDSIGDIRAAQVPRAELERVFLGYDQRFQDQQRQLDEQKNQIGSVYGARDVILELKKDVEDMRRKQSSGQ